MSQGLPSAEGSLPIHGEAGEQVDLENSRAFAMVDHQIAHVFCQGQDAAEEAAEVLGISLATVEREWRAARAWLLCELEGRARG